MRVLLLWCLSCVVWPVIAEERPFTVVYPDGWNSVEYHRLDAQLSTHSSFGITLNPEYYVSEVRVSFALSDTDVYSRRDEPFTLQLTLRGWKLMETNLETKDTDYFERERVRDRDIRKQLLMLSIVKSF